MERNEAIKVIKRNYPHVTESGSQFETALRLLIPELKESEGERIRKWLIRTLKSLNNSPIQIDGAYEMMLPAIAWLEKQGEQKPAEEYNITGIGSKHAQGKLGEMIKRKLEMEKQGEQKSDTDFSDLRTWKYIVDAVLTEREGIGQYLDSHWTTEVAEKLQKRFGNIEQKPIEWSEEDKKTVHLACEFIRHHSNHIDSIGGIDCSTLIDRLKSLKDRVQPQPKWSEEDCNQIETIACHLDNIGNGAMAESLLNIMDKYKSIRPRNTWKPSDEQVEALVSAIDVMIDNRGAGDKNTILLSGLYHELKAL